MVARPGRRQADEFAEGEERKYREERQGDETAKEDGGAENGDDPPPGSNSGVEICHRIAPGGSLGMPSETEPDQGRQGEKADGACPYSSEHRIGDHSVA